MMQADTKRNIAILFFAQALPGSQLPIHMILSGLAGALLASDSAMATLPVLH